MCFKCARCAQKHDIWVLKIVWCGVFWLFPIVFVSLFAPKPTFASMSSVGVSVWLSVVPWCDFELGDQRPGIMAALNKETLRSWVAEILLEKKQKWHRQYHPCMVIIFTYVYHNIRLNVGKYTVHGSYGSLHKKALSFAIWSIQTIPKKLNLISWGFASMDW